MLKIIVSSQRLKNLQEHPTIVQSPETRSKLIAAASAIFAQVGYEAATTRQICIAAGANSAAVNYHFGDKLELYKAVLQSIIQAKQGGLNERELTKIEPTTALRLFIAHLLENTIGEGTDSYARLMAHEMAQPTPGLAIVVEQLIRPRAKLLCRIVGQLSGRSACAEQTRLSAHCIIGQIVHYMNAQPILRLLWPEWKIDSLSRQRIADHIWRFSCAALADVKKTRPRIVQTARAARNSRAR